MSTSSNVVHGGKTVSPSGVDLDVSRLSQHSYSSISSVTLGGSHYPVGTTVGSSGLFVIGDPSTGSKQSRSSQNFGSDYSFKQLIVTKGYTFEDWNWPVIRFSCFLVVVALMLGLLAAVIGLVLEARKACYYQWEWWQGSTIYRIKVNEFYDELNRDDIGDIKGIVSRLEYLQYLGISAVSLSNFLPSIRPYFDQITKFDDVDQRMGTAVDLQNLVRLFQSKGIKVMLELDPTHTSEGHVWFEDSRLETSGAGGLYDDFYVWRNQPGADQTLWREDTIRNQYYRHMNDSTKPVLDWSNPKVQAEFERVLKYWLRKGVDGFHMLNMENMYGATDTTVLGVLQGWRALLDKSSTSKTSSNALMVGEPILKRIQNKSPGLINLALEAVDLIDYPFTVWANNATECLVTALQQGGQWQTAAPGRPWVSWRWTNMSRIPMKHWMSIEMYLLVLPGTPSIHAGQEIGREPDLYTEGRVPLIQWTTGEIQRPYQKGSILDITTLSKLVTGIGERLKANSLRSNGEEDDEDGKGLVKKLGYNIRDKDAQVLLLERYYKIQDVYYWTANFGDARVTKDWSDLSASGQVLADSMGEQLGNVRFDALTIEDGQSLLMNVPRWLHRRKEE